MIVVYRKMQNGKEFMKIMDGTHALSVLTGGPNKSIKSCRVLYTSNQLVIRDYQDDHVSMPSSELEFLKACKEVQGTIKQFFNVTQS